MLGVFVAYFVTIVLFAGLYLAVNKAGEYYGNVPATDGGGGAGLSLGSDTGDAEVASFCGMDINNHMEGESFYRKGQLFLERQRQDCLSNIIIYNILSPKLIAILFPIPQHFTLVSPQWPQLATARPITTSAIVGHPFSSSFFRSFRPLYSLLLLLDCCSNECHGDKSVDGLLSLVIALWFGK